MAGNLVRVIPTRTLDFSGVLSPAYADVVLKSRIDVREWATASLVVKVLSASVASGTTLTVGAFLEGPTPEDPAPRDQNQVPSSFVSSTFLGTAVIDGFRTPPFTLVAPLGVPLGSMFRVVARGSRVNGVLGGSILAVLSVDACLRNG
jgi:hypothetical protein